ncbi:DUF4268 domain-containing protein [Culicoidibacter larvae]|uniref:DUF4268 domain-containing protein n=1 Tax=Culicoidibacter larvae TaxID=2579976 RepID=A0A5R8QDX0_9FIRM|nr:DUF4268 domain-containing protein [Culicoidibacter larvae]
MWYNIAIGSSYCFIALNYNTIAKQVSIELYITDQKALYYHIEKSKTTINEAISESLEWMPLEGKKACRIKLNAPLEVDASGENWDEVYSWIKAQVPIFKNVFTPYIKSYTK